MSLLSVVQYVKAIAEIFSDVHSYNWRGVIIGYMVAEGLLL